MAREPYFTKPVQGAKGKLIVVVYREQSGQGRCIESVATVDEKFDLVTASPDHDWGADTVRPDVLAVRVCEGHRSRCLRRRLFQHAMKSSLRDLDEPADLDGWNIAALGCLV